MYHRGGLCSLGGDTCRSRQADWGLLFCGFSTSGHDLNQKKKKSQLTLRFKQGYIFSLFLYNNRWAVLLHCFCLGFFLTRPVRKLRCFSSFWERKFIQPFSTSGCVFFAEQQLSLPMPLGWRSTDGSCCVPWLTLTVQWTSSAPSPFSHSAAPSASPRLLGQLMPPD